ncbi:Uma2 domain-containing protein [Gammaproteobacteria bacterium]
MVLTPSDPIRHTPEVMETGMSALPKPAYISPEEYLLGENDRPDGIKHEYVNGQVYAMAGASRGHNRVSTRFAVRLSNHLEGGPCEVFQSDMKVGIQTIGNTRYYYPDIQVTCEEETESYFNRSPCLIIEVLSESTARKDRTEKLTGYRLIPTLQEYVLCSQDSPVIELYRKPTAWQRELYRSGQTFLLESVGLEVVVDDIYSFLL